MPEITTIEQAKESVRQFIGKYEKIIVDSEGSIYLNSNAKDGVGKLFQVAPEEKELTVKLKVKNSDE